MGCHTRSRYPFTDYNQDLGAEELLPSLHSYTCQVVAMCHMRCNPSTVLTFLNHCLPRKVYLHGFTHRVSHGTPTVETCQKCHGIGNCANICPAKEPRHGTCDSTPSCSVLLTSPDACTATAHIWRHGLSVPKENRPTSHCNKSSRNLVMLL